MDQVDDNSVQVDSQPTEFVQSAQQVFDTPEQIEQPVEQAPQRDYEAEYNNVQEALRQERARADELARRAEFIERVALNNVPSQSSEPSEPEFDPNYIPDNATVERLVEKKLQPILSQVKDQQLLNQENMVRSQNPDWDEAFEYYKEIVKNDPEMHRIVMASKNAPLRAYQIGRAHPDFMKKTANSAASQVVNKINSNLSAPPTLNNINGASQTGEIDWSKATRQQVLARARQIEGF